jgi:hypothetical protein
VHLALKTPEISNPGHIFVENGDFNIRATSGIGSSCAARLRNASVGSITIRNGNGTVTKHHDIGIRSGIGYSTRGVDELVIFSLNIRISVELQTMALEWDQAMEVTEF